MSADELIQQTSRFRLLRRHYQTAQGESLTRHFIDHPGAVAVIALTDQNKLCLIRNRRFAVRETLIELPAGTLEPDESPREAAIRELEEESGYRAHSIQPITSFWMSPGILAERMHVFLAERLEKVPPRRDPGEEIETIEVTPSEAFQMISDGTIQDAKTIAGLLFYDRFVVADKGGLPDP